MATGNGFRAIDKMKRAMRKGLLKKTITLADGTPLEIHYEPLTLAEEQRIRDDVGANATANAYALRLLIEKGLNPDRSRMFTLMDLPDLKNNVEKQDAEAAMLVILGNEGEPVDMKSPAEGAAS
jgi:hypothetical protein